MLFENKLGWKTSRKETVMRKRYSSAFVVVALAVILTAGCDKNSFSPSDVPPGPDQGGGVDNNGPGCGPFGQKVYLKDNQGHDTSMWAILHWVRPACGAQVNTHTGMNPVGNATQFQLHLEGGYDLVDYITGVVPKAAFRGFFSLDGTPSESNGIYLKAETGKSDSFIRDTVGGTVHFLLIPPPPPKFLVIWGKPGGNFADNEFAKREGTARFGLDYR